MVWVRNVFLNYEDGAKRLNYLWGEGETSFLSMSWGETSHWKMMRTDYGAKSLCTLVPPLNSEDQPAPASVQTSPIECLTLGC